MITQEFNLNLIPDGGPVVVHVNQYDHGTGRFVISLYKDDEEYAPTATVKIEGRKPDGNVFSYAASLSGNVVTADVTQQMTAVAGRTLAQVVVTESSGVTGTLLFWMDVQRAAINEDAPVSETEIPAIIEGAEAQAQRAEAAADNAAQSETNAAKSEGKASESEDNAKTYSLDAEAWARGTRNNTAVSPGDATYQNNSMFYAGKSVTYSQLAGEYMDGSKTYSLDAEAWARGTRNNTAVSPGDATYQNNSMFYAGKSAASQKAAAVSETNAKASEDASRASETNADKSREDAEAWAVGKRNGKDVGEGDATYHNSSEYWARQAAASAAHGGHTIVDMEDTVAPVRTNLKFMWSLLQDDEDGDTTKVYPSVLLTYMALNNDFLDILVDEEGSPIIDGEGNAILVDWRYEVA